MVLPAATPSSARYDATGAASTAPAAYWPRTTAWGRSHGCSGRIDLSSFTFSSRIASASKLAGGSMAVSASTCRRWFCTMSRSAPACS